ncbi:MAG: isochorismatase family protein [Pseudonocardiaceae bacterium]
MSATCTKSWTAHADRRQIDKYIYTLFTPEGTRLVNERGWADLYVCGIDTDVCVLKTAVDAFEHNFTPWILKDACASHAGSQAHTAGLLVAGRFIGTNQIIHTANLPESAGNQQLHLGDDVCD